MESIPKLSFSLTGAEHLVVVEDWRNAVYPDIAGNLTIGVGHMLTQSERTSGKIYINGIAVKWSNGLSNVQVMQLMVQDLESRIQRINELVRVPLAQHQFDALVLFVFNIGRTAFENSTLLRLLNSGDYHSVPAQLRRWIHADGKPNNGLKTRRDVECAIWAGQL
jgi:lysozyme